jgi:hypothetical protein
MLCAETAAVAAIAASNAILMMMVLRMELDPGP